jgi:acyl-CoA thioesterase FadM
VVLTSTSLQTISRGFFIFQNMEHHFNIEDAKKYGIVEAVILHNIRFWIMKNKANNTHLHDGEYWTYNSVSAFTELFPYLTKDQIRRALESAEYGLVTNDSSVTICNEAETLSKIVVYAWTSDKSDYNRSFLDMEFEWFKQDQDGKLTLLATSRLSTTWVKIVGHGVVKQSPLPEYVPEFFDRMRPRETQPNTIHPGNYISINDIGSLKYESTPGPRPAIILNSKVYQTSLYDGNAVGNLYYSNYYDWQAKNIESFIHKLMPELFIARGKQGEYICLECQVNHLQEAMPFEEIEVNMYLERWFTNGFKLYFEYYSLSGGRRKLAYGNNTLIWALRDHESAKPVACELPTIIQDYFQKLL